MSVKVKHCLLTITLISVFNLQLCEASKKPVLFNVTEDAISIGREMFREVENLDPRNTNLTIMAEVMFNLLEKFHNKHNTPSRPNYFNTNLQVELHSRTLMNRLYKIQGFDRATHNLEYMVVDFTKLNFPNKERLFSPDPYYLEENVFNLQIHKTPEMRTYNLYNSLFKEDPDTGETIMNILTNEPSKWVCWSSSRQQMLYNILNFIITEDAFRYVITQYHLAGVKVRSVVPPRPNREEDYTVSKLKQIRSTWREKDVIKRMRNTETEFIERNKKIWERFIPVMAGQSREAWSCGQNENEYKNKDMEFSTKLENLFQMYVINEVDLNQDGTCKKECGNYNQAKQYGCYDGGICKRQRTCGGSLWDCRTQIDATMNICVKDKNETERYRFIKAGGETYGTDGYCNEYVEAKSWPRGFYKCTYCTCTCEEMNNKGDRYFNLRPVQSDIKSNYVISNARFTKVNNIVHIQIEEGHLLDNGYINQTSLRWKDIENYTIYDENVKEYDYHTITWNKRKVYLGDYDSSQNNVITGLRLSSVSDGIKLEVGYTPFDFATGKLSNTLEWSSHANFAYDWSEVKFENKDEVITNSNGRYVQFTTNDVKIDAGQSTIPYIDTDFVVHLFRVPFSGAGLFTKNKKGEGSYLSLKFLTYDFVNNM